MSTIQTPEATVLSMASPAVHRQVLKLERMYPQLNGRALRAGPLRVAAGGAVQPDPTSPAQAYTVTSAGGNGRSYCVTVGNDGTLRAARCTCRDYLNGLGDHPHGAPTILGAPKCKHICAVAILRGVAREQDATAVAPPPPLNGRSQRYESASAPSMARTWVDAVHASQGRAR